MQGPLVISSLVLVGLAACSRSCPESDLAFAVRRHCERFAWDLTHAARRAAAGKDAGVAASHVGATFSFCLSARRLDPRVEAATSTRFGILEQELHEALDRREAARLLGAMAEEATSVAKLPLKP